MSANNNPYAPPQANVADPAPDGSQSGFIEGGRSRPIGDGVRWIGQAMKMFFAPPWWKWLAVLVMLLVLFTCIALVPILGIVNVFLGPIIAAGIACIADSQRRTGDFAIGDAFKGFNVVGQLLLVGVVLFVQSIVLVVCMFASLGIDGLTALANGGIDPSNPLAMFSAMRNGMLVALVLSIPFTAATLFAPQLIMLHGLTAFRAMKNSFLGAFKNVLPGLLCFIVVFLLMIVSILPAFLGLIITVPVMTISTYTIYRGIFTEEPA